MSNYDNMYNLIDDDEIKKTKTSRKTMLNYFIDIGMAISFITTFLTGVLKFPGFLTFLDIRPNEFPMYEVSIIHDYGALFMGLLILAHLLLHAKWLKMMTVKKLRQVRKRKWVARVGVLFLVIILLIAIFQIPAIQRLFFFSPNTIIIEGIGDFKYKPEEIESIRPDIFKEGHFSIFDVLVYLDNKSKIDLDYHFETDMNTYVIDDINGKMNWWYEAYYDGGWPEDNVYRMDHYPYKDKMYIKLKKESSKTIQNFYNVFNTEIQRLQQNGGKILIPQVMIRGTDDQVSFQNVEVTAHNLRNDVFQDGVITAIDVIMSLGDQGRIDYELQWYNSIGTAEIKDYYVDKINGDRSKGRCGFVYEAGSYDYKGFKGNHIHIPADIRVINSPEYEEWFWICL